MKKHVIGALFLGKHIFPHYLILSTEEYTKEEAMALFQPITEEDNENGPAPLYKYRGRKFAGVAYLGVMDDDEIEERIALNGQNNTETE